MTGCPRPAPRPPPHPLLPTSPGFFNIFILLSQTGANGMCGQDFRIHHWLAEELAWAPCITCQSCQACCLPRFIIALALCCLSPLCARFSPARKPRPGGREKKKRPYHAPQCQPWSPATKLGYTVALLEIRKRERTELLSAEDALGDKRFSLPPLILSLLLLSVTQL